MSTDHTYTHQDILDSKKRNYTKLQPKLVAPITATPAASPKSFWLQNTLFW